MAGEIATAYVSLTASGKNLGKDVEKQLGDAGMRGGVKAESGFTSKLGGLLKKSMIGVGVAAGGVLAASLVKGWGRLANIENATAKLDGLGHSAQAVQRIMDNALASVKGTAFGLDEAAQVAAGVVASGVKPGQELEQVLKTVADTATIAGISMGEMGAIFNKVSASGKIQGEVIAQLGDRGIPILQLLGKSLGKTAAEVRDMASEGVIDFAMFEKAMREGVGGAALKSGETTAGAFKNMGAALSRFGATLLKDVFPLAKIVFGGINSALDALAAKVGPAVEKIMSNFTGLGEALTKAFAGDTSQLKKMAGDLLGKLGDAIVKRAPQMMASGQMLVLKLVDGIVDAIPQILDGAAEVVQKLADGIARVLPRVAAVAGEIVVALVTALADAVPQVIDAGVQAVQSLIDGIIDTLPVIIPAAVQIITTLANSLINAVPQLLTAGLQLLQGVIDGIVKNLPQIIQAATKIITQLVTTLAKMAPTILKAGLDLLMGLIDGIINNLPKIIDAGLDAVFALVDGLIKNLPAIVKAALDIIVALVGGLIDAIPKLVDAAFEIINRLVDYITDPGNLTELGKAALDIVVALVKALGKLAWKLAEGAVQLIGDLLSGLWDALTNIASKLWELGGALIDAIWKGIGNLAEFGKNLLEGIWNGIKNLGGWIKDKITGFFSGVWDSVTGFFGISSPSKLAAETGKWVVLGFAKGLDDNAEKARKAALKLVGQVGKDLSGLSKIMTRSVDQVAASMKSLRGHLREAGASKELLGALKVAEQQLTAAMSEREKVTARLQSAQDTLNGLMDAYKGRVAQVTASMQEYVNLTGLMGSTADDAAQSVDDLISRMASQAQGARAFADNIAKLRAAGLNATTLQQLVDAGADAGGKTAAMLATANDTQIGEINRLMQVTTKAGQDLGTTSAEVMYRNGIDAAEKLVAGLTERQELLTNTIKNLAAGVKVLEPDKMSKQGKQAAKGIIEGLESQKGPLVRSIRALGESMLAAFKKSLEIASPSKLLAREIGRPMVQGIAQGIADNASLVDGAVARATSLDRSIRFSATTQSQVQGTDYGDLLREIRGMRSDLYKAAGLTADGLERGMGQMGRELGEAPRSYAGYGGIR